jgi:1,4-dihydroxy-2-naphthoate octaprenyltransferase
MCGAGLDTPRPKRLTRGVSSTASSPGSPWLYAVKPASWPKLLVPAALGQAMGLASTGHLDPLGLVLGLMFTLADGVAIVLLNDWGDREVDAIKRRMFPDGCSPKTIPDGILPARALLVAGLGAALATLVVGALGAAHAARPELALLAGLAVAIFGAYTFPPLALNYRGGGELLEALGVGVVLPWVNALFQGGPAWSPLYAAVLPGAALLALASALASGLSDEESDRAGGKRTFTTALGNTAVRRATLGALALGALAWAVGGALAGGPTLAVVAPSLALLALHGRAVARASDAAVTNAFAAQARFKGHLHRALWDASLALAVLLGARGVWLGGGAR